MKKWILLPLARFLSKRPGLVLALVALYLLSPFDLLPEALTGFLGYFDDVLLVAVTLLFLSRRNKNHDPLDAANKKGKVVDTTATFDDEGRL